MSKNDFDFAVNPLIGADWQTFKETTRGKDIGTGYINKYILTKTICSLLNCTAAIEEKMYQKKVANLPFGDEPVFILGHWRSGTTFVHGVLSQDSYFGYNTTYQTIFPHMMLFGQSFMKTMMGLFMPKKRPTDGMELNVDFPQEEEFALANMTPYNFYNFWFFPKHTMEYSNKYLLFNDATKWERQQFKDVFEKLVKLSMWNTGGKQFLSKNPPHTGRVDVLLELFPKAKFIYLMRNPYTVFESTRSFFTNTIQPLKLQDISDRELQDNILQVYKDMYHKYQKDKQLIPAGNLIEVKFEDFEADAAGITKKIYQDLNIPSYAQAENKINAYIASKTGHKKNNYQYRPETVDLVNTNWGFALDDWGYEKL